MCKLRSIIFCCGLMFFITAITTGNALARPAKSGDQTASVISVEASPNAIVPISVNLADVVTLQKVKGIGKKKSQAILDYRNKNGQFKSLEDLLKVDCRGINKKWLDKVSKFLTI